MSDNYTESGFYKGSTSTVRGEDGKEGPEGPQGPIGPPGADGAPGAQGPKGLNLLKQEGYYSAAAGSGLFLPAGIATTVIFQGHYGDAENIRISTLYGSVQFPETDNIEFSAWFKVNVYQSTGFTARLANEGATSSVHYGYLPEVEGVKVASCTAFIRPFNALSNMVLQVTSENDAYLTGADLAVYREPTIPFAEYPGPPPMPPPEGPLIPVDPNPPS